MIARNETIEPLLWTVRETLSATRLSESKLYRETKEGRLPAVRIGRRKMYDPVDVRKWIQAAKTS